MNKRVLGLCIRFKVSLYPQLDRSKVRLDGNSHQYGAFPDRFNLGHMSPYCHGSAPLAHRSRFAMENSAADMAEVDVSATVQVVITLGQKPPVCGTSPIPS